MDLSLNDRAKPPRREPARAPSESPSEERLDVDQPLAFDNPTRAPSTRHHASVGYRMRLRRRRVHVARKHEPEGRRARWQT